MEIWDLYDENRQLVGELHIRGTELPDDRFHLVVHVWIRSSDGKFLISQRSADRPTFPMMWECVGGSVLSGEDSVSGAVREVQEELGLSLSRESGKLIYSTVRKTVNGQKFNDILDVWLFNYDGPVFLDRASTKEVAKAAWLSENEIKALFNAGIIVPTLGYFFDCVV